MSISPLLIWAGLFLGAPFGFFLLGARIFPYIKKEKVQIAFKFIDVVLLIAACIINSLSFVMFWASLLNQEFLSLLICVTGPVSLIPGYYVWHFGMMFLLAKSGVSTYVTVEEKDTLRTVLVVKGVGSEQTDS